MRALPLAATLLLLASAAPAEARRPPRRASPGRATIVLEGESVSVRWTDGDTFRILSGRHAGSSARLVGVNALETYGPVHRWGGTDGRALLAIAKRSAAAAAAASIRCTTEGARDAYHRLLAHCPEVAEALVRSGDAMVFAVDGPPEPRLLALQREAQQAGRGMWAYGAPPLLPSSLHSADEPDLGRRGAYDRIVDTRTGLAEARPHGRTYRTCEEVCVGAGRDRACMVYVPFARRYRDKPACLRGPRARRAFRASSTAASGSSLRKAVPRKRATRFPSSSVTRTVHTEVRRVRDSSTASAVRTPRVAARAKVMETSSATATVPWELEQAAKA
jgi:endonuclease YncB( thermonuclease family)